MPASSAMRASLTLSGQVPDQRSGTNVTARPDEQLAPNRPILSALPLYMAVRSCMKAVGASMELSINIYWRGRRAAAVTSGHTQFRRLSPFQLVMAVLVTAIYVFDVARRCRRGWPGQARP